MPTKATAAKIVVSDWDPLEESAAADPGAAHASLRAKHPIAFSERWGGFWALTKYEDIVAVTQDPESYSSFKANIPTATGPDDPARGPLELDPPFHGPYRTLLNPYFAPRRIRAFEDEIRAIAGELLDAVIGTDTTDVVPDLTFPMPVRVLCAFLGLPPEDGMQLKVWANEVITYAREGNREGHRAANAAMYNYIRGVIAERRAHPRDPEVDLICGLIEGKVDGTRLTEAQIAGTLRLLFAAGHGTTTNAMGNSIRHLGQNIEHQQLLRENPALIPGAVEEILRAWSPSRALGRVATRDIEIRGRRIKAGQKVALIWASGNRDGDAFENPDDIIIDRRPNNHIAFGNGIHTCLGAPLARAELKVLIEELLARTKTFKVAGPVRMAGWPHLGPDSLPVEFQAAEPAERKAPTLLPSAVLAAATQDSHDQTRSAPAADYTGTIIGRRDVASGVVELTLASSDKDVPLPPWKPGAHIDLKLKDGITRQYSLCGDPDQQGVWRVAVLREPVSRGGSVFVHDELKLGMSLDVRGPRNHFALAPSPRYIFIAGGIGITPVLPMIRAAEAAGANWSLLYAGRSLATMAYRDELAQYGDQVTLQPRDTAGRADLSALLSSPVADTKIYCCGPQTLLQTVEELCQAWPSGSLHVEHFLAKPIDTEDGALDDFDVVLKRSGATVHVGRDMSIVDACAQIGVNIPTSCLEGTCGSCETAVLGGVPAHRDSVLTPEDKAENAYMMPCISRSCSRRLTLDL